MSRTILVMAGGTGGHIMPALAVAQRLRSEGWRVVWLGAEGGMEGELVPKHGYEMRWIRFGGLRGKGIATKLLLPFNLLRAFKQAAAVIREIAPNVVLGMGGYVTFPGGMMASLFNRPLVIHEQNSIAGLANKVLAGVADRVLVAFPDALKKSVFVGNPVRDDIVAVPAPAERFAGRSGPLHLLVVGGSLGAQALNEVVPQALAQIPVERRPRVVHQAGTRHIEQLRANYAKVGVEAETVAFIDDMARAYAEADLVICRAGATTVAELAAAGVASILVPYPHAVDDHQTTNARYLADAGAAILIPQPELTPFGLAARLEALTREQLLDMANKARALGKPDAAAAVAKICSEAAK
ncbi:MAG: undecaprenyldiphospho-muramoylpentapeptide beta-N-acetylglucosaminyltransferase [Burkholderiales bacterium]|nr:undecaprenyldiphospho-muramoylpentapeptide beta-N-acetylglucosaminyltransferase [Burkholderiales bacterium]